eukprot:c25612_g1_i1.p1 GENE.c25612_g1_i1~~c25612_g1_i1.p1  ORF type:complete len:533 (+),score=93.11 c25612_g1_i1:41-1639(+)
MRCWVILVCAAVVSSSLAPKLDELSEPVSFLSLSAGPTQCTFLGDTHVTTNFNGGPSGTFNVMGENEWIAARSRPKPSETTPYFELQTTQITWNTASCAPLYPHITVAKDVAMRCGSVYILYKTTRGTGGADGCPENPIYAPKLDFEQIFISGTLEGRGKFDFQQFVVGANLRNQRIYFDGRKQSFQVTAMPCEQGCAKKSGAGSSTLKFFCDEAEISIIAQRSGGASHTQVTVTIPDASQVNSVVRNGNYDRGFCAGWQTGATAPAYATDAASQLAQCLKASIVADTFATKGNGQGQPGETGSNPVPSHKGAIALFYTTDPCRNFFLTSDTTSIFRLFELKTKDKTPSYDSIRWSSDGATTLKLDTAAIDKTKQAAASAACEAIRRQFDNRPLTALSKTVAKDLALISMTANCAEDTYFDLPWDVAKFSAALCTMYQGFIDRERQDIKCADMTIRQLRLADQIISVLGFSTDSDTASAAFLANLKAMQDEISNSQANIVFWDNGECPLVPLDLKANPIDCSHHTFVNTLVA